MKLNKSALVLGITSLVLGMQMSHAALPPDSLWVGGADASGTNNDYSIRTNVTDPETGIFSQTTLDPNGVKIRELTPIGDTGNVYSVKLTTITASGLETNAIATNSISLNGVDLQTTIDNTVTTETNARIAGDITVLQTAQAYTDTQVSRLNSRVDDVEKTAYRGVAIALAAQQAIPNIKPGQFAVFGGVGHYEGESAGALGVTSVFADGRTSLSAAVGVAGGSEVGGRVGVSYVFGGK